MVRPDLHLPQAFVAWMAPFLAAFRRRSRDTAAALAVGALLAIGPRTVTNCLRALGLAEHPSFTAFHRVLNRNVWSGLALARTLLGQLVPAFEPSRPFVIIGVDHTLERRRGRRIEPASHFHDAVGSTAKQKITSRGLRWISAMLLVQVPFAGRIWGLPVADRADAVQGVVRAPQAALSAGDQMGGDGQGSDGASHWNAIGGRASAADTAPLAARPHDRGGHGRRIRRHRPAASATPIYDCRHPPTAGRLPV